MIEKIYKAIQEATRSYGHEDCTRPNSFAVLNSKSLLNAENLGKTACDAKKEYFWSRQWESRQYSPNNISFDWPLVSVFEMSGSYQNLFHKNTKLECFYNIQIGVLDNYKEDCNKGNCRGCAERLTNEIERDTEIALHRILLYLSQCYWIDGELVHESKITTKPPTNNWVNSLRNNNPIINMYRYENESVANLFGTLVEIKVSYEYCPELIIKNCPTC